MYQAYTSRKKPGAFPYLGAVVVTLLVFVALPLTQKITENRPERREVRRVEIALPPPPPPPPEPPPPENKTEPEPVPELREVVEQLSLAQLDLALNPGTGGAQADFAIAFGNAPDALSELQIFELSDLDRRPQPIFRIPPEYPHEMRRSRISGVVTIVFVVDPNGNVLRPEVQDSTHREFERPAIEAVSQWRFEAGVKGGENVSSRMRVPIRFNLAN
jgi:periplasmic protein TonB